MTDSSLRGIRILVIEDEYLVAEDLRRELDAVAVIVLGPTGTLAEAIELIRSVPHLDGAILDVNLRGEMAFPAADLLMERGVPFIFTTGYNASALPRRYAHIARCEKPFTVKRITRSLGQMIGVASPESGLPL